MFVQKIRAFNVDETGGPPDWLKWSTNPYRNQYFVLRGPPTDSKWSAHRKILGTTALGTQQS